MLSVICDDDVHYRQALARSLGGHVLQAANLETALRLTKSNRPNVIVLDVLLPDGIGWEAIPRFREAYPHVEIIVVTALGDRCDALRAVGEYGAFAYVEKIEGAAKIRQLARRAFIASLVSAAKGDAPQSHHPSAAVPLKRTA